MATTLLRMSAGVLRRTIAYNTVRAASDCGPVIDHQAGKVAASESDCGPEIDHQAGKVASDKVAMPDTLGHSVGIERYELLAKLAGNEDPFEMNVKKRAKGTVEEPTLIPSLYEKRLVGCICEEDAVSINWMYLHKGEPRRCECGYWFKLTDLHQ